MFNDKHRNYNERPYMDLNNIYPTDTVLESENYIIESYTLSEDSVKSIKLRDMMSRTSWMSYGLQPNFPYVKLVLKQGGHKSTMMSDTPMERTTNRDFVKNANGDVLIFGLGLGLIILPLMAAKEVKSITVVELHKDLIELVSPILKQYDIHNKLIIEHGDCFEYNNTVPKGKKWDCIYGDIWVSICPDNYSEMKMLTKNWQRRVNRDNPNWILDHWLKSECKRLHDEEKKLSHLYYY